MDPDYTAAVEAVSHSYSHRDYTDMKAMALRGIEEHKTDLPALWDAAKATLRGSVWKMDLQDEWCNRWFETELPQVQAQTVVAALGAFPALKASGRIASEETDDRIHRPGKPSNPSGNIHIRKMEERENGNVKIAVSAGSLEALRSWVAGIKVDLSNNEKIKYTTHY